MRFLSVLLLVLFFMSCGKDNSPDANTDLPDCIKNEIDFSTLFTVQAQQINGESHYWLNTGANALDGDEFIVNAQCDTVCFFGGWVWPDCLDNYSNDWIQVWPE